MRNVACVSAILAATRHLHLVFLPLFVHISLHSIIIISIRCYSTTNIRRFCKLFEYACLCTEYLLLYSLFLPFHS
ncbi:hypothetical protein BDF22DRAFT_669518 [Syncephalis plumigaleata]|nr:hypothetical protein BDF22DRAFT_669518 [Syncephalis plumigaleata]